MFSFFLRCAPTEQDQLSGELFELGTSGIQEEPGGLRAFFEDGDAGALREHLRAYAPILHREEPVDWEQVSRDAWPPLKIGERFFLAPPWCEDATPAGRIRLEMTPGTACGTGHHPATQLCLEALERVIRPGDTVIDVGTGSGILSVAAKLLGAGLVVACDIDLDAVTSAKERLGAAPVFAGSANALRTGTADAVVANINSATAETLAEEFVRISKPRGSLIVSGFPEWDAPTGFQPEVKLKKVELKKAGWLCWICY